MFRFTVFEILLFDGRLVLGPTKKCLTFVIIALKVIALQASEVSHSSESFLVLFNPFSARKI